MAPRTTWSKIEGRTGLPGNNTWTCTAGPKANLHRGLGTHTHTHAHTHTQTSACPAGSPPDLVSCIHPLLKTHQTDQPQGQPAQRARLTHTDTHAHRHTDTANRLLYNLLCGFVLP